MSLHTRINTGHFVSLGLLRYLIVRGEALFSLTDAGVTVQFIKEQLVFTDKDNAMSKLFLSVMGAVAEFERSLIRERQREGIILAKTMGLYMGRKKSLTPERGDELRRSVAAGEKKAALAREFGISRETLYQYAPVDQRSPVLAL